METHKVMGNRSWISSFLAVILLLFGVLLLGVPHDAQALSSDVQVQPAATEIFLPMVGKFAISGPPSVASSLYITTLDAQTIYNEGCALGKRDFNTYGVQNDLVVMAFGYPQQYSSSEYGAAGFAYPKQYANTSQIAAVVENFGKAYWDCVGSDFESHLRIAVGTSNYPGGSYSSVTSGHGRAWAQMVNGINAWFNNPANCDRACDGQVDVVGGSDIELTWNSAATTIEWVNGYTSAAQYPLYNFGAIEGCPYLANPTANCYWKDKEQVWYVIWGAGPVQPIPEIYLTTGVNAQQWYLMSVYSYVNHGQKIQFPGLMTEYGACQQRGGCSSIGIDNTPSKGWWQLYNLLNNDLRTAAEVLPYLTDIKYLGE